MPEKRILARPFYEKIRDSLISFAQESSLEFIEWYHDMPLFVFGVLPADSFGKTIQIFIDPNGDTALIAMHVLGYYNEAGRNTRIRRFAIARLRMNVEQSDHDVKRWLNVAGAVLRAMEISDLLEDEHLTTRIPFFFDMVQQPKLIRSA